MELNNLKNQKLEKILLVHLKIEIALHFINL